jgi:hypothetical protein
MIWFVMLVLCLWIADLAIHLLKVLNEERREHELKYLKLS